MSSTAITITHDLNSISYAQVAIAVAVLYDHALTFAREIDYIWRRSPSLVAALYLLDRYVGDSIVIIGAYLCLTEAASTQYWFHAFFRCKLSAVPGIMQLRIYAMYRRARWILGLLLFAFFSEVLAVVVIIWKTVGLTNKLVVTTEPFPGRHSCSFSGINTDFIYLFIPVLCFETLLFSLAIKVSLNNMRERRAIPGASTFRINSFMSILVRDSILYFFMLASSFFKPGEALSASMSTPFIMLLETMIGTRVVINFKEHCFRRLSSEPVMITGSIRFAGVSEETARIGTIHDRSTEGDEMQLVKGEEEITEVIVYEEL
ncbi:uncharacterized protein EDB93DRAFT_1106267 [Suillus bovinus]|uniref:uncharacterized protein n=1 Tax=Suillus bovinus TaxID=48563 RepID=UPI001B863F53|nr:uncharacterized protein EDB93DRAFT_1106267 [Suillus bovinus]KAG2138691.1 hypothetical protein EDB93DRAFT_1106267 [Suillus bovinus]